MALFLLYRIRLAKGKMWRKGFLRFLDATKQIKFCSRGGLDEDILRENYVIKNCLMQITVLWNVTTCYLIERYQHFGGICCLCLQGYQQELKKRKKEEEEEYGEMNKQVV
jgi:hypothetical protein